MASSTTLGGVVSRSTGTGLAFSVLGDVSALDGAGSLPIGGQKQRAVLAMLIAGAGRRVPSERLVEAVYGDPGAERGRRRVQTYVSTLRSVVGDVIVKDGSGWRLTVDRSQIDALRFEDLYESVRDPSLEPEVVAGVLREALELWRGHPYADVDAHGLLDAEVARLNELRVSTQAARLDADLATGRDADLVGEIEALMIEHPYQERFRAHHMLALYRAGRQREALRSFEALRKLLVEEIGADPSPELQELERRILDQDPGLLLRPASSIRRRAVLVADSGDPLELARLPAHERDASIQRCAELIRVSTADIAEGEIHVAGNAIYAVFESVAHAVNAATNAQARADDLRLRLAIDWGDLEAADDGVSGPPVSRVAVLVSVAHAGQVLLSADAQQDLTERGGTVGVRFEMLGSYELVGIEGRTPIFQLLIGDRPRSFPPLVTDRTPPPLPGRGDRAIPGYELRDAVGVGSIGTLHRAYQPAVGREVLIEVIGRAEASDADFIRRFEADAQRLTLLDHPNISPVLDYWRQPDGAFVVHRYHRGGFLDPTDQPDGARIIDQVGAALAAAHALGVVHGSVRPDRVALDEAGNAYLMGFPIAGLSPRHHPGYAAYIAPETLAGTPPSVASDVYALGVLAQELLSGAELPADGVVTAESAAITRALSEDPCGRMASVAEFLVALDPAGADAPHARFTETRNPYKGLAAFHEADSQDFFGREAVTRELVESLSGSHLLAVVGPSGIGKSSVVRAGLVARLRTGALPGSERAVITDMLPGSHPFLELRRALERVALDVPGDLRERLADRDRNALDGLAACLPDASELVLIIDQFEELFTMTDPTTASEFLGLLVATVEARRARIIVTLRADFLDRPLLHSEFGELLRSSMVTVRSPAATELVESIVRPAQSVGVTVDPAVAERMSNEVLDRPGALPLLQHALTDLFDARTSDRIDLELFEQRGGVTGSLARRAESVFGSLGAEDKPVAKQVFLRLLTVADDATPTRRRVRLSTLDDLRCSDVVDVFVRSRLLVLDTDPDARAPTVEVAHEALLTHWPRLAAWIDTAREDLTFARRLDEAVHEWEANDRDDAYLLTGGRLAQYDAWRSATSMVLDSRGRQFLASSAAHDRRRRSRARRRRNLLTGAFAAAAVVASVLGLLALRNATRASENESAALAAAEAAQARELLLEAESELDDDPQLATLLARASVESFRSAGLEVPASAADVLRRAIVENRVVGQVDGGSYVTVSADGATMVTTDPSGDIALWDVATLAPREVVPAPSGVLRAWLVDDELRAVVADLERTDVVRRSPSGAWESVVAGFVHEAGALDALAGDGRWFAAESEGRVRAWDTEAPASFDSPMWTAEASGSGLGMSGDGRLAFLGPDDDTILVVDAATGELERSIDPDPDFDSRSFGYSFSDDGERLAVLEYDSAVSVYDLAADEWSWDEPVDLPRGDSVRWVRDDTTLLVSGEAGLLEIDADDGNVRGEVGSVGGTVADTAPVPATSMAFVVTNGDSIVLVDLELRAGRDVVDTFSVPGESLWMSVDDAGTRLTALGRPSNAFVFALPSGGLREFPPRPPTGPVAEDEIVNVFRVPVMDLDGSFVASVDEADLSHLWSTATGEVLWTAPVGWDIRAVSNGGETVFVYRDYGPDGAPPRAKLVTVADGSEVELDGVDIRLARGAFAPDDSVVAIGSLDPEVQSVTMWAVPSGELIGEVVTRPDRQGGTIDFSRDGRWLAVGGIGGTLDLLDLGAVIDGATWEDRLVMSVAAANSFINPVVFSPDSSLVATVGRQEPVVVWSIPGGERVAAFEVGSSDAGIAFHPTEPWVYLADAGTIHVHTLDVDELMDLAAADVGRDLTEVECQQYLRRSCN